MCFFFAREYTFAMKRLPFTEGEMPHLALPDEEYLDDSRLVAAEFIAGLPEVMEKWGADVVGTSDATGEQQLDRTATWYERLKELQAEPERGEVKIPGVRPKNDLEPRTRKLVPLREVAGDEKTDKLIADREKELEDAQRRRRLMQDPWFRKMKRKMDRGLGRH
jgi:hypothetical protein